MADKYVKLNDIIDTLEHEWGYEGMREDLQSLPAADVQEVRRGEWISASAKANVGMKCNVCGARIKYSEFFNGNHNYCHKCGADMRPLDKH